MKIMRVVHQQVFQLRWQLLACLGLIMVLPLEEAAVNLYNHSGFYSEQMIGVSLILAPFLAGLIACANVQADLDDKRFIFWMSKPTRIVSFITLKYIVGVFLILLLLACPALFCIVTNAICGLDFLFLVREKEDMMMSLIIIMISLLTYSLCFLCNVLVRKTARAWLIGMTMTAFLLLMPFMLPLMNFRDVVGDFHQLGSNIYVSVLLATVAVTFLVSQFAVKRNWHLRTNLKGLFWAGAGFVFILMMIFSRQVANIKVLDEIEVGKYGGAGYANERLIAGDKYVNAENGRIVLETAEPPSGMPEAVKNIKPLYEVEKGLWLKSYPDHQGILYKVGDETYYFKLALYHHKEKKGGGHHITHLKKVYLCSYKMLDAHYAIPVAALDLSDLLQGQLHYGAIMRLVEDKLVIAVTRNFAIVSVKDTGEFELLNKKINALRPGGVSTADFKKTFKLPLVAAKGVAIEKQIKLSIDVWSLPANNYKRIQEFYRYSIVDVYDGRMSFFLVGGFDISRYDVIKWDEEFVYCEFRDARPFTVLEQMVGQINKNDNYFVKDGKLYASDANKLLIFDIRSSRIRKLGHFERLSDDFEINYIEVLGDGNILLSATNEILSLKDKDSVRKSYLYLLKNPE